MRRLIARLSLFGLCSLLLAALAASQASQTPLQPLTLDRGANGLGLALRRVGMSGRVLYVTAHPDDEHNGVLVRLSRGLGLHTALLTVTRGEGGQNAIGPELFDALGVLRTGELMALHRYDGVAQYFGRAYEFGYSFSVEETLAKWGYQETLGDIVRVVRTFRPDVILTLPLEGTGGGQHHQAVARLTREAFRAAADEARFTEQRLRPWQARKLYAGGVGGFPDALPGGLVHVATGVEDPLLGMTWQQLGSRARALHLCQGADQLVVDPGAAEGVYSLVDAEPAVSGSEADILDGIDTSLVGLARSWPAAAPALEALQARASAARAAFDPTTPEKAVAPLVEMLRALRALRGELQARADAPAARFELDDRLAEEEADVEAALAKAQALEVEARADDGLVTPGETFGLSVSAWNQGRTGVLLEDVSLEMPAGWLSARRDGDLGELGPAGSRRQHFAVTVPGTARASQPYWRRMPDRDRHELLAPADETLPWSPPLIVARVVCRIGGVALTLRAPAVFRYAQPLGVGEKRHEVTVVPELAVRVAPEIAPVPTVGPGRPIEVHAFVRSEKAGGGEAAVRLEAPPGWTVRPPSAPLRFAYEGEEVAARFLVSPPAGRAPGVALVHAVASRDGREYRDTVQAVEYAHVERRQLVRPAETRLVALDVRTAPAIAVGYVMGSGDAIPDAIRGLGVPLTLLSADDLAFGDLARFSTIVTGIRAYETRPDLRSYQARLMRWVEAGGHLVVQYNRAAFNRTAPTAPLAAPPVAASEGTSPFAPYPAAVSSARISDETAGVRLLAPDHVLLRFPNRIGDRDWAGWVQERAIQLLATRDARYTELLAATDPFPYNPGEKRGLLVDAQVGAGSWTYVGLVLFREVPAGVPGAWRLLANLISRPRPGASAAVRRDAR
jgi:LmbE family N-acetylglucosaminyl deacetylase